jgi:hypothetical protein
MSTEQRYAVDRINAATAVLIDEHGNTVAIPKDRLGVAPEEGMILFIPVDSSGTPDWYEARVDQEATEEARKEARKILDEVKERDPGGDVKL